MSPDVPERDETVGAALSGLPVPEHGPTFWADLAARLPRGETTVSQPTGSATDAGPAPIDAPAGPAAPPVSLDGQRTRRRARRGGRRLRHLGAAAAAVALVVAATGAVAVIRGRDHGHQVSAAGRPTPTTAGRPAVPAAPAEFSATYDGIEGQEGPAGCCRTWRLTLAGDGSFRWTSTDGTADMAYDATTGRHVEVVSGGAGASKAHPNAFVTTGFPAGPPDQRAARPDPLGPIADFVVALARAGDPRVTATTADVGGPTGGPARRAAWHYDGPTLQDRLGGPGAPDHADATVDQASGVLLSLERSVGGRVVTRFRASAVSTSDRTDRSTYRLDPPAGARTTTVANGFVARTLDGAAADVPYPLLVPGQVPAGFTLRSVSVDRDVPSQTGAEGMNPPARQIVSMTWRNQAQTFTVTLRPKGADQWDDPFGAEGLTPDAQPVDLALEGRPALEGTVVVDAPIRPHLWGITGDVVVTVSGGLGRAELEAVARSLRAHPAG
ncbi:MAG TPA: hypothetical protein VFE55_21215 [Acidimicrobiia bacterium]|nr:hypothetical protein [Acidimicrobiia bacterium]